MKLIEWIMFVILGILGSCLIESINNSFDVGVIYGGIYVMLLFWFMCKKEE